MNDLAGRDGCNPRWHPGLGRWGTIVLTLFVSGVFPGATAWAHKMVVFATVQGKTIHGDVYYQDGSPAQRVAVSVLGPTGDTVGTATTDAEGKFTYPPQSRFPHKFVVDGGFGHRAEYTVPVDELPADRLEDPAGSPPSEPSQGGGSEFAEASRSDLAAEIQALNRQIIALREDLGKWKTALRMQDVMGGVGYILGILGVFSYFLAGRRRERAARQGA